MSRRHANGIARLIQRVNPHHPRHVLHSGYTVLVTRADGDIDASGNEGLFDFDTRILSVHRLRLGGKRLDHISGGPIGNDRWEAHLAQIRPGGTPQGPHLPEDAFGVRIIRRLGPAMLQEVTIENHSMAPAGVTLSIELDADFADILEVDSRREQRGVVNRSWDAQRRELLLDYRVEHEGRELRRGLRVRLVGEFESPRAEERTLSFPLELPAKGRWGVQLVFESLVDGGWRSPLPESEDGGTVRDRARERWAASRARIETSAHEFATTFEAAAEDLHGLRNWEYDAGPHAWVPNAGVPTYTGLFGRDVLTAGWQSALLGPEMMQGALARLAETQANEDDAWHDAAPGKLVHEMRKGPLSELGIVPQDRYYGEQSAPSMFIVVLSECWHWTGDEQILRKYRDCALAALEWARRFGDADGDGLLESRKRSPRGLKNHSWKDSDEAIRYPDGRIVPNPIASIEEQSNHFAALLRMAEILVVLHEDVLADQMLQRARQLKKLVNDRYWIPELDTFAIALDPDKHPVRTIGSDPAHALSSGIVEMDRAKRIAGRLMKPDMFSGWGVRTLSSEHPSYNPFGYHIGTVWPVANSVFALGCKRYGLDEFVLRIVEGQFAAAQFFTGMRLPEAIGGHPRSDLSTPTVYPKSNFPQAWSAGAVIQLTQTMLGLYPVAALNILGLIRPTLPSRVPELVVRNLRVGSTVVSLRFARRHDQTVGHEVLDQEGPLTIVTAPPPADLHADRQGVLDHLKRWGLLHAPGRAARALRISAGLEV